jgi:hypothetical protein
MRSIRRIAATPVLAIVFVLATSGTSFAGADNAAVAINTKDATYVWRQAFKIERVAGDVVDEGNGAWAESTCEHCRTAAVAMQVLIAIGDATTVTSTNIAGAVNDRCDTCATYAGAFQFIVTPHDPMRFTDTGNAAIDGIKADLQSLLANATFGPTFDEVDAFNTQVKALADRLQETLQTELVQAGGGSVVEKTTSDEAS